jgi:hypothetical protein
MPENVNIIGATVVAEHEIGRIECLELDMVDGSTKYLVAAKDAEGNGAGVFFIEDELPDEDTLS